MMSDKKHIDRLFQEKFKDFEAKPNPNVWENIQKQLEEPKSKPKAILPLWLRLAGVAAILALLFGLGTTFLGNNTTIETVEETNNPENIIPNGDYSNEKTVSGSDIKNANTIVGTNATNEETNTSAQENNNSISASQSNTSTSITQNSNTNSSSSSSTNALSNKNNTEIVNTNSNTIQQPISTANNNTQQRISTVNNNTKINNTPLPPTHNKSLENINVTPSHEVIAQTNNEEEKTNMNPKDEDAQTPNPLEEATLASTEDSIEKEKEETVMNRWTVNANVAPVYYNTLGKGSHIHDQFIDNPKNGEVNTSYGIHVGYAVNDKLKVRSGINKLNLSYDTADVIIYENVSK